jgi:hypothetical protein
MRLSASVLLVAVSACSNSKEGVANLHLPQVYPPVRAATPSALILDSEYAELGEAVLWADGGVSDAAVISMDSGAPYLDASLPPPDAAVQSDASLPSSADAASPSLADAAAWLPPVDGGEFTPADASPADASLADAAPEPSVPPPGNTAPLPPGGSATMPLPPGGMPTMPTPPGGMATMPVPPGGMATMPVPPGGMATMPVPPGSATPSQPGAIQLATAIQERFYSAGPTSLLRIVKELDDRVAMLDTNTARHPCLTEEPVASSYALPGGQTFGVKLQCLERSGSTWLAFGFDRAASADAGNVTTDASNDFYLVTGQESGMGGAYRIEGKTGNVEAWITVADENAPTNSQVILHLLTNKQAGTLELSLAGSGVGFCAAHLKTNADYLWVSGKTNGAAPPGTDVPAGTQYCDAVRSGCFAATALASDLGAAASNCADIASDTFAIHEILDASSDAEGNVNPATLYGIFNTVPAGVATF